MNPRPSLSVVAIILGTTVACASSNASSLKSSTQTPTNAQIEAAETGVPASIDYANRPASAHSPTNAEICAAEQGNPDSPGYKDAPALPADPAWKAQWESLDRGTPAEQSAQPDRR